MGGTYAQTWVCSKHYPHDEPEEQPVSEDCPYCQIAALKAELRRLYNVWSVSQ